MAVIAVGASSHAPMMLAAAESAPATQRAAFFGGLDRLVATVVGARPDTVVIVSNEHFTNFFYDNMPAFCVGVGDEHSGPVEDWLGVARGQITGSPDLALALVEGLMAEGFEPAFSHRLLLDHGIVTVYHRFAPLPLIPFIQNCAVPPMPALRRCYELGLAMGRVLAARPERVAVIGAGGLSHFVGVPRVGEVDDEFDRWFLDRLQLGDAGIDEIVDVPDHELEEAGNGAHEIRSWLTAAGVAASAAGDAGGAAKVLAYEPIEEWITGMAVAVWE